MSYTNPWALTTPLGSTAANLIDDLFRSLVRVDIVQRINTVLGTGADWSGLDPIVATYLNFGTTASPQIIGGATDLHFRNNANNADNIIITDAGNVSISRGTLGVFAPAATNSSIEIRTPAAGLKRSLFFTTNGSVRWEVYADSNAESGSNNGSNFQIAGYNDSGVFLGNYISIFRSTGEVIIPGPIISQSSAGVRILNIDDNTDTAQFQMTISGSGGLQIKPFSTATTKTLFLLNATSVTQTSFDLTTGNIVTAGTLASGNITISQTAADAFIIINANSAQNRIVEFQTAGNNRWVIGANTTAEGGSSTGSDFFINRYNDAGAVLDTPLFIQRANGFWQLTGQTAGRARLTGVANASAPSFLDIHGSPSATPNTYSRLGGLFGDYAAGAISKFGIFSEAGLPLEFRTNLNVVGLSISSAQIVTIGSQTAYPSGNVTDGSNTLEFGWSANVFYFKQTQATDRDLRFRNHSGTDIMIVGYGSAIITINGQLSVSAGYQINSAAASTGHYLRGNGSLYVDGTIQNADLPNPLSPTTFQINAGATVSRILNANLTWQPGGGSGLAAGAFTNTGLTVTGAQVGDMVIIPNPWGIDDSRYIAVGWVSAANNVVVQLMNPSSGAGAAPTSRTIKVWVIG